MGLLATDNIKRIKLRPKQKVFVENAHRWSMYVGGLGAGKTYAGAVRAIIYALKYPGSFGLIGAPTYPMLRDTTQRTFFDILPEKLIKSYNKNEALLTLTNGSEIIFRSMDQPDRIRGLNLMWFWLDEAPFCGYYAWKVAKARAGRQDPERFPPFGWATGTPRGMDGFYEDFEGEPQPDHFLVRASTYENSVNLPDGYAESLGYEGNFKKQEIEGLFTAFEGLVYNLETETGNPNSHMLTANTAVRLPSGNVLVDSPQGWQKYTPDDLKAEKDQHGHDPLKGQKLIHVARIIGGVDWGYTNPAAVLPIAITGDEEALQLDEFYKSKQSLQSVVLPQIVEMTKFFEVETWYCDPAEPDNIIDLRHSLDKEESLHCGVLPGDNSITSGIQTVIRFMAKRGNGRPGFRLHPDHCTMTRKEFGSYQYAAGAPDDVKKANELKRNPTEIPEDKNNHALGALRYALHTAYGVGRSADIGRAAGQSTDIDSPGNERQRIDGDGEDDPNILRRREQNAKVMRGIETMGLPLDGLFNPWKLR